MTIKEKAVNRNYGSPTKIKEVGKRISTNYSWHTTTEASKRVDTDQGRYSRRCTWHKTHHDLYILAAAKICGRTISLRNDDGTYTKTLSVASSKLGWRWVIQDNMIGLVRRGREGCDYHFATAQDFAQTTTSGAQAKATEAYKTRRRQHLTALLSTKREAALLALAPLVKVTIGDSRQAGNCLAGTMSFARQFGVGAEPNIYQGIPATKVLESTDSRAKNAVRMACLRCSEVSI